VPINTTARDLIKKMETGDLIPSPDNIALLEAAAG
jgi:hypothetical protein